MAVTSPRAPKRDRAGPPVSWGQKEITAPVVPIGAMQGPVTRMVEEANTALRGQREWSRMIAIAVQNILDGKIFATGEVTLTASAATTTLTDKRISPDSVILFMPTTANAAAEMDDLYVSARGEGTATITHPNNANADKAFGYCVIG